MRFQSLEFPSSKKLQYVETALINSVNKNVVSLDILGSVVQIEFQNGYII